MESKQNLYYYHITTNEENIIKGEYNKQILKFIFYVMKYKGDSKIEVKLPLNLKQFKFDVCLEINFKKHTVSLKSNDKKYSNVNKMNSVRLTWNIAHSKKSEVFCEENRKYLISIYDQFDYYKMVEIKRPIRIIIKKRIFSKIMTINSFFDEIRKKHFDFIRKVEEYFRNLKDCMENKIKLYSSHEVEISSLENLSMVMSYELFQRIKEIKNFILIEITEIEKLLTNTFYKKEYYNIIDETFNFEEFENNSKIEERKMNLSYFINFYNFNTRNESILKIKNSENNLVYLKNKNQSEYFSFKNITTDKIIKLNKDSNGCIITFDKLMFMLNSTNNSFYFGELNLLEEKEGFGVEGFLDKDNLNLKDDSMNFYIGGFKNNIYNGIGALDNEKFFYQGEFVSGKKKGKCAILIKKEKEVYIGEVKENLLEGRGKYLYNSEELLSYEGDLSNSEPNGKGKILFKNFDFFEGEFQGYKQANSGVYKNKIDDMVMMKFDKDGNEKKNETVYKY